MTKVARDHHDFEQYGGTLPPRPGSVVAATLHAGPIPEKEHRAAMYDFASTRSHWVNRDLTDLPEYKGLSPGFRKVLTNPKVALPPWLLTFL
jgi:hypothetical protein